MGIGKRLKEVRGDTIQKDFAAKIGVSLGAVQKWEYSDTPPGGEALRKIYEIFGININWLLSGDGPKHKQDVMDEKKPDESYFDMVPMAVARLNAGGGSVVISEGFKESYAFRKEWVSRIATGRKKIFLMQVEGDSMQPTIYEGDTVMIDQGRTDIRTGRIYAIGVGDTIMVKRLELLPDTTIKIRSDNQAYDPYITDASNIRVIGQVIWFARELVKLVIKE